MPSARQLSASTTVIRQSLLMLLFGLVWGLFVANTPFPRLALVAHLEAMTNGTLWLAIGSLLRTDFLDLGGFELATVQVTLLGNWTWLVVEVANSWWGTNGILPIAASQAGAGGATALQEMIVTLAHVVPGLCFVFGLAVLVRASYARTEKAEKAAIQ